MNGPATGWGLNGVILYSDTGTNHVLTIIPVEGGYPVPTPITVGVNPPKDETVDVVEPALPKLVEDPVYPP